MQPATQLGQRRRIQKIKYAPPPPELPVYGAVDPREISYFGRTNYEAMLQQQRYVFGIKRVDRRRHMYVVGKTGVGKSKLLELLIRQDVVHGHGLCVIDPHGDFMNDALDFIPESRIEDTVVVDPSDAQYPVTFNPLMNIHPDLKHQAAQSFMEVIERQFGAAWTPRLEHVFRFTALAMLDYPEATVKGMIRMLVDRNYRQRVIPYVQDDMVKRFWAIEFADWSEKFDTEAIIPLVNKLGQFLSNPLLGNIFGQKANKVDIEKLMEQQKIILINLSKGKLGVENSSFFGSMFVTKIYQAGMARAALPPSERKDFYFYVDEFQNVVTETFEELFSESRKYGLNITVAHQYVSQLDARVFNTVLGNIGTIISFRVGGDDARKLVHEMTPVCEAKDMVNLGVREFYIKMTIDGEAYDPFSAETLDVLSPPHRSFREEILAYSRKNYAVPVEQVKEEFAHDEAEQLQEARKISEKGAGGAAEAVGGGASATLGETSLQEPLV